MPQLLVTRRLAIDPRKLLAGTELQLDQWDDDAPMPREALLARAAQADALVCTLSDRIDEELLSRTPRLRVVANHAVGLDNVDRAACARRGIAVTHTPDVLTDATADLALALLLAVARRLREGEALVRSGGFRHWAPTMLLGLELSGATLAVVGFGRIGRAVARRAAAFGMRVLAVAQQPAAAPLDGGAVQVPLAEALAAADVVSLHTPLTPATRHLIGAAQLAGMKRGAILVNTARGPVVDEAALVAALEAGHLGGAGLDVYEQEPTVHPGLLRRDDVVLLPHLGSATRAARAVMGEMCIGDALRVLRGESPRHLAPG